MPEKTSRRADAERNREKILTAARAAFVAPEGQVSMAEIARRAGVGMATLYRNFPERRALLEALVADEFDAVVAAAELAEGETPGEVFAAWLRRLLDFFDAKHPIASELLEFSDGRPFLDSGRDRILAAGSRLLEAAQQTGEIRDDLTLEQVLDMVVAIAKIRGDSAYVEPILAAALDGLRARTGR